MSAPVSGYDLCSPPRVIVAGRSRDALGGSDAALTSALSGLMEIERIEVSPTPAGTLRLLRAGAHAIRFNGYDAVHALDARLAPAALLLRARFGVPVTASLTAADAPVRRPSVAMHLLSRLDHAFTGDDGVADVLARRAPHLPVTLTRRAAAATGEPTPRALDAIVRLLRDVTPGRLVVAVPWPEDDEQVRWLRDAVAPLLRGRPVILLLGAPRRRRARLMLGAIGLEATYRVHTGALDADTVAAAGRCADVFMLLSQARREPDVDALLLAMMASRAPVVTAGGVCSGVLQHEHNGLAADREDAMSLVSTLNQLLALPAVQRHFLGEEFAASALRQWTWDGPARVYAERFAALAGRPQIPLELRAA